MITLKEMSMLTTLYTQPHRKYHNINHINACLVELENLPSGFLKYDLDRSNEYDIVETAIWYHDAVYNPYSKLNEAKSVKLLPEWEDKWYFKSSVSSAIYATAKHTTTQKDIAFATQVMLDIDLSGFGKSLLEFVTNGMNIRHEYYNTTLRDFLNGRLSFYKELAKRETLYYTDYFRDKYHKISQENMKWEIDIIETALAEHNHQRWGRAMEDQLIRY